MMLVPDVFGCPHCDRSIRGRVRTCPGCGFSIGVIRLRLKVGDRENIIEKLVAAPPVEFARIKDVEYLDAEIADPPGEAPS